MLDVNLLIAVPTYNEAKQVESVIEQIRPYAREVLIVDDGSTDATPEILSRRSDVRVLRQGGSIR